MMSHYTTGPFLESDSPIAVVQVPRSKDKQALVTAVIDTLMNLLPSSAYINTNINSGMGYVIDAEFFMDSNLNPLPFVDKTTGEPIDRSKPGVRKGTKIGIMVLDYHDITRGAREPSGITNLAIQLAQKSGYKVITVPYYEFNSRDKLVIRVQYLEQQLKNIFNKSSTNKLSVPS